MQRLETDPLVRRGPAGSSLFHGGPGEAWPGRTVWGLLLEALPLFLQPGQRLLVTRRLPRVALLLLAHLPLQGLVLWVEPDRSPRPRPK